MAEMVSPVIDKLREASEIPDVVLSTYFSR
jgi:hypothetical protein